MSAAHVEVLNRLLGESLEFREFTAKLSCERVLTDVSIRARWSGMIRVATLDCEFPELNEESDRAS